MTNLLAFVKMITVLTTNVVEETPPEMKKEGCRYERTIVTETKEKQHENFDGIGIVEHLSKTVLQNYQIQFHSSGEPYWTNNYLAEYQESLTNVWKEMSHRGHEQFWSAIPTGDMSLEREPEAVKQSVEWECDAIRRSGYEYHVLPYLLRESGWGESARYRKELGYRSDGVVVWRDAPETNRQ
jgi:hypothetical protein